MKKITVEVCCGTTCYVLGAAKLLNLETELPDGLRDCVELKALPCLDLCIAQNLGGAPFVRINGTEIMAQATLEKLQERLTELIAEE